MTLGNDCFYRYAGIGPCDGASVMEDFRGNKFCLAHGFYSEDRPEEMPDVRTPQEKALTDKFERVCGYVPVGLLDILHILSHPDVIVLSYDYLDSKRDRSK